MSIQYGKGPARKSYQSEKFPTPVLGTVKIYICPSFIKTQIILVLLMITFTPFPFKSSKVEKIEEDSLDSIPLLLPSVKIQIIGGKVYLRKAKHFWAR